MVGPERLERRLKSLDEFERPPDFPRFVVPSRTRPTNHALLIIVGMLVGGLGGLPLFR